MSSQLRLRNHTARSPPAGGMFNTPKGKLQQHLHNGEYSMFKNAPMFESDFVQVSKRGEVIDVHNAVQMLTVGIICTSRHLVLPDVMLLAIQKINKKGTQSLELTRLLPLKLVKISIHNVKKQQLCLKLASGRSFYLQLCPRSDLKDLFAYWEHLVYMLNPPVEAYSLTHAIPANDTLVKSLFMEEEYSPEITLIHIEITDNRPPSMCIGLKIPWRKGSLDLYIYVLGPYKFSYIWSWVADYGWVSALSSGTGTHYSPAAVWQAFVNTLLQPLVHSLQKRKVDREDYVLQVLGICALITAASDHRSADKQVGSPC
ncbi:Golgi-associated RAB2 interactor protein 6-like [Rhynchonycteris naso]